MQYVIRIWNALSADAMEDSMAGYNKELDKYIAEK